MGLSPSGRCLGLLRGCVAATVAVGIFAVTDVAPQPARAQATTGVFPLYFHLVHDAPGRWSATRRWIDSQIAAANERFRGADVQFASIGWIYVHSVGGEAALGPGAEAWLPSVGSVSARVDDHTAIDVFVVEGIALGATSLRAAVDSEEGRILGLSLAPDPNGEESGFIAIVPDGEPVLAHELGHFFGLSHSTDPHNLMRPDRPRLLGEPMTLDDAQLAAVRVRADEYARSRRPPRLSTERRVRELY